MEHLKKIKYKLINCVYEELEHNWENINLGELGEVIDMIKDLENKMIQTTTTNNIFYIRWQINA